MEAVSFGPAGWGELNVHLTNLGADKIIYSTVANEPPQELLLNWAAQGKYIRALDRTADLPFISRYTTLHTLGKDRIAAMAGAVDCYPDQHCLVVDAGSCITTDLITADAVFEGGNISPGLRMRLRSMHEFTARLPLVEPGKLLGLLGTSTELALRQGGQGGAAYELEGLFHRLVAEWTPLNVVLTGGDAPLLSKQLSIPHLLQPHLVHFGLSKILDFYANNAI